MRISIVCFDAGATSEKRLDGVVVSFISSDLTSIVDITKARRLDENQGLSFMGVTPAGPFDVDHALAEDWLSLPLNTNGRTNADVVRPYWNGRDVTGHPRNQWIVDFGTDSSMEEAAEYEAPFEYVFRVVRPIREQNAREAYRKYWWRHAEARRGMRKAFLSLNRYIATSMVSRYRFFIWLPVEVIPANLLIVFARNDDYFFGILQSRTHEVWARRMGTWLGKGNDPRYTPTTSFETFPFPWAPGIEPVDDPRVMAIAAAAKELDEKRRAWLDPPGASEAELKKRTLTNLYNERPTWLRNLHARLDRAVWDAYGWPADEVPGEVGEEVILERLLVLNATRSGNRDVK